MKQIVKIFILIGFVFASFILGVLIAALGSKECISYPCKTKVTLIKNIMDTSANPCKDFYKFACGKYNTYNSSKPGRITNMRHEWDAAALDFAARVLGAKPNYTDNFLIIYAKDTFVSCASELEIEDKRFGRLIAYTLLTSFGFPMVQDNWEKEPKKYSIAEIEIQAWRTGFTGGAFVDIKLEHFDGKYILFFSIPRVTTMTVPNFDKTLNYYLDVYKGIVGYPPTKRQMEELKLMAKLKVELTKAKQKYPLGCPTAARLTDTFDYIDGNDFGVLKDLLKLERELKGLKVTTVHLQVYFLEYVKDVGKIIEKLVPEYTRYTTAEIQDFMIFEYFTNLVHFLPKDIRNSYDKYMKDDFERTDFIPNNRTLYCAQLVKNIVPKTLATYYLKTNNKQLAYKMNLKNLVDFIKQGVMEKVKNTKWIPKDERSKAAKQIKKMKFVSPVADREIKKLLGQKVDLTKFLRDMCFANAPIEKIILLKKIVFNMFIVTEGNFTEEYTDLFSTEITFNRATNTFILPLPYVEMPFVDEFWPKYLTFSVLGRRVALAVWKALRFDDSTDTPTQLENFDFFRDENGKVSYDDYDNEPKVDSKVWKKSTMEKYLEMRKCFLKKYNEFLKQHVKKKVTTVTCVSQLSSDGIALQSAFIGYRKYHDTRFHQEPSLPGMKEYNNDQHFFIDLATYYCHKQPVPFMANMTENTITQLAHEFQLNQILVGDPQFVKAFGCKKGDPMNPKDACPLF